MSIQIKSTNNYQCHYSGFDLYIDGQKCHYGTFASVQALRAFWAKYRFIVCAGYRQELSGIFSK